MAYCRPERKFFLDDQKALRRKPDSRFITFLAAHPWLPAPICEAHSRLRARIILGSIKWISLFPRLLPRDLVLSRKRISAIAWRLFWNIRSTARRRLMAASRTMG